LALSVGLGLGVLHELMEAEVDEVVGPKGRHNPDRDAVRHGHQGGEVTLGVRRAGAPSACADGDGEASSRRTTERAALTGGPFRYRKERPTREVG
jgi:hypothetical protein